MLFPPKKFVRELYIMKNFKCLELKSMPAKACKWFAYSKAFQTTVHNKSYAQALMNAVPPRNQYTENAKNLGTQVIHKNSLLAAKVTRDDKQFNPSHTSLAITSTVSPYRPHFPSNNTLQTSVTEVECERNVGVTVTGARSSGAPVLLKNRFQPLQMLMRDDYNEPRLEETLQGFNNDKHSFLNAVNAQSIQSHVKPLLASQENEILAGKKNKIGSLARGIAEGCNTKNHLESANICQATLAGESNMHRPIDKQIPSRNSEPQYIDPMFESCLPTENEVTSLTQRKPHIANNTANNFGFIPKAPLWVYTGEVVHWQNIPNTLEAHKIIKATKTPNYMKCRIPVQSGLNIKAWRAHLSNYWDQQLCDLLEFGFPLDFEWNCILNSTEINHTSAIQNSQHISHFIQEEIDYNAMLGPFDSKPIHMHVSPLLVRDKQNSNSKRTIMDLSWPRGASVNDGVKKDVYLGTEYDLRYPSVDTITNSLKNLGTSAQMYKIDISRAFRHIKVDPADTDLLGIQFHDKYFLDRSVAFGFRHGSLIFQRCTDAIRYIMAQNGFPNLFNYIDDLIYTGLPSEIHSSFTFLKELLSELGLDISFKKLVPLSTSVIISPKLFPPLQISCKKLYSYARVGLQRHIVANKIYSRFSDLCFMSPDALSIPDIS